MINLESMINSIFIGFCSYMGARVAKKTHKKIKNWRIK